MPKFAAEDSRYLAKRKEFSAKYGAREIWSVMDHWQLYCGTSNLARSLAILDIFRSTLDVPGHIAEFGSWRGANLLFLAKLLRIHDPMGQKLVHCFDSFEGLTTFVPEDGNASEGRGDYKGSLEEMLDMIDVLGLQDDIVIHKGLVQNTLIPLMKDRPELSFSMVYCDLDLYEPSKIMLEELDSRLAPGGVFVFDEWNYERYPGETLAVREFMERVGGRYRPENVRNARQPSLVLRKL